MLHYYEMKLRPAGIGCQPQGLIVINPNEGAHGIVGYSRKLTDEELEEYEMAEWGLERKATE